VIICVHLWLKALTTEAPRPPRILRPKGCQGGRMGGQAPLIQEGYGAFAPGVVTGFRRGWRLPAGMVTGP
jgi:hypothetical protein